VRKIFGFVLVFAVVFTVLMVLHPGSTPETATDSKAEWTYGPTIPASTLKDPTLANAPTLQNSTDSDYACRDSEGNIQHCTDDQMAKAQAELQKRWDTYPEWLRKKCVSFTTMDTEAHCEVTETVAYLNKHPGETAPWTETFPSDEH
jgi:hypothetical protein